MKGILGRKIGMTQVFSDHGRAITVSIIEIKSNVVSAILSQDKNGYSALQLALEDKKKAKKPEVGHFKKAKTSSKKFVKEIRNMKGFELGQKVNGSIFVVGELVDVTGISKGKGFAGAIKRHNQSIGPKSHGGGGGSKPTRQTGSLGDISGNKVVKGMTMPGHMGNVKRTVQNLEVISIDLQNNILLVKGSIPGPKKSFVIVKNAVKKLPNKEATKLVDIQEFQIQNELLENSKKIDAKVNIDMPTKKVEVPIENAKKNKQEKETNKTKIKDKELHQKIEKTITSKSKEFTKQNEAKLEVLEKDVKEKQKENKGEK